MDYGKDLEMVVNLIRQNLNPVYSKEFLLWKHYQNPFGKSVGMVATRNEKIVGVVFYMRYDFKNDKEEIIRGLRPVDGCTDADQRGKGIFKILMESCLAQFNDNYDILLATPNNKSLPELIKLDWKSLGDAHFYKIGILNPFFFNKKKKIKFLDRESYNNLGLNLQDCYLSGNSLDYIQWRYSDNAYKVKVFVVNNKTNYIIYRRVKAKGISYLVICEYIGDCGMLNEACKEISKSDGIYIWYFLSNEITYHINFLFRKKYKKTNIVFRENNFSLPANMIISLGDLEGRI